jgi:hypothetical protein
MQELAVRVVLVLEALQQIKQNPREQRVVVVVVGSTRRIHNSLVELVVVS